MKRARLFSRICGGLFLATLAASLVYMIWGLVEILNSPATSFPWYTACVFTLLYFGLPLAAELVLYLIFRRKGK